MAQWTPTDNGAGKPSYLNAADAANTFGVDSVELGAAVDQITTIAPSAEGSGYGVAPVVTIAAPSAGVTATATAVLTGGHVTGFVVTAVGSGYTVAPVVTVAASPAVTFNGSTAANTTTDAITITTHNFAVDDLLTYANGGGTSIGGLVTGNQYYVVATTVNTFKLSTSKGGTVIDLTAAGVGVAHTFTGETSTATSSLHRASTGVAHTGWVKKTVGTGNRSGRVSYETLVATDITGDNAADNVVFPNA